MRDWFAVPFMAMMQTAECRLRSGADPLRLVGATRLNEGDELVGFFAGHEPVVAVEFGQAGSEAYPTGCL